VDAVTRTIASLLTVLAGIAGCLGTTPSEARRDRIGTDPPEGPTHNAGNDCLACHDFVVAGTVYLRASDAEGLGGARVTITDAADRSFEALTNRAGNFFVEVGGGGGFSFDDEGRTRVGFEPTFPLRVRVSSGDLEEAMITSMHRQGSCNTCHDREAGAASVGRVYLLEEP
jgi:hypothetical protein